MSNGGSNVVIHGKKDAQNTLEYSRMGTFQPPDVHFWESVHKAAVFSANMKHIYCLICSKVEANKCKIVDLSFQKMGTPPQGNLIAWPQDDGICFEAKCLM